MFDIITFGSATKDIFVRPKQLSLLQYEKEGIHGGFCFVPGSKVDVEEMIFSSGGGGTNVAATFAKQGFKTAFVGVVGPDLSGQEIIRELNSIGINTRMMRHIKEKPTNHSVIILNENLDRTVMAYRGASEMMSNETIPWGKLKAKWLYLAPLTGLLAKSFQELVNFAKERGIKISCNPSIAQLSLAHFADIVKNIDILILNREEASFLTKIPHQKEAELFKKIDEICPGIAVMTKGGDGVTVSDGKHVYSAKPHETRKVVDTLGAGDSFGSGFVAEYMRTADIEKAIQFGMANSEACLTEIGSKNGLLKKGAEYDRVHVTKQEGDNNVCLVK